MPRKRRRRAKSNSQIKSQTNNSPVSEKDWQYHRALVADKNKKQVINTSGFYSRSKSYSGCNRIDAQELQRISDTPLFAAAIAQIANTILRLEYQIIPPGVEDCSIENQRMHSIQQSLNHPNCDRNTRFTAFIQAIVKNLLVFNVAPVERCFGADDGQSQSFWFWDVSPQKILRNPAWSPQNADLTPKYYCKIDRGGKQLLQPIMEENLFLLQHRTSSNELIPKSPVEIAYDNVRQWLGLAEYQERVVSRGVKDYILSIETNSSEKVKEFRDFWEHNIEGSGSLPVVGGKLSVHKIGAKSDDEMFLAFQRHLASIIALSFNLTQQDFNIEQHSGQNRATAEINDARTFYNAILPLGKTIFEGIDLELVNYYHDGYHLMITTLEPSTKARKKQEAREEFESGAISLNEYRQRLGLPELPNGNIFRLGNELIIFDEIGNISFLQ